MARNIRQSEKFKQQLSALGGWKRLRDALTGVFYCIRHNAEDYLFSVAPLRLGIVKTTPADDMPEIRVSFWIHSNTEVEVYAISAVSAESVESRGSE